MARRRAVRCPAGPGVWLDRPLVGRHLPRKNTANFNPKWPRPNRFNTAAIDPSCLWPASAIRQADVEANANCVCTIGAVAACSRTSEKSKVESCEHQDNANVDCQPFQESVSKKRDIHTDDYACHCRHVKRDRELPAHFSFHGLYSKERDDYPQNGIYCWTPPSVAVIGRVLRCQ